MDQCVKLLSINKSRKQELLEYRYKYALTVIRCVKIILHLDIVVNQIFSHHFPTSLSPSHYAMHHFLRLSESWSYTVLIVHKLYSILMNS